MQKLATTTSFDSGKRTIPNNYKIEIKIATFSDTIRIILYSDHPEKRDDLILNAAGNVLLWLFRYMFARHDVKLRGAMGIGDFYLIEKNGNSILMGNPMFEVATLYEVPNWMGVITTPSATLTMDQINSFGKYINKIELPSMDKTASLIIEDFFEIIKMIDVGSTYFINYKVPLKKHIGNDCYALAWPLTPGQDLEIIENRLSNFLDYKRFQNKAIPFELYEKYRNTLNYFNFIQQKRKTVIKLSNTIIQRLVDYNEKKK